MSLKDSNILFFTRTMELGGTENVILQLCEIFQKQVNKIIVCSSGGVNVEKLDKMGIKHYAIDDVENKSPKVILSTVKKIKKIVRDEEIDIIHTHHRMAAFYVALAGLHKKCLFINTSHNTFQNRRFFTRFAFKHAKLVTCGEMVKKNITEYFGIKSEKVEVITNAVKPFTDDIVEEKMIKDCKMNGDVVIGNIGRLSEQKGMEYYVKAVPNVIKKHPNVKFFVIGEGEDRKKLEALISDLDIKENVFLLGYRTDVQNLMSQLDFVVLSSLWEGFPLTPIEAFSVGKTVIATAVDGTVEIVSDKVNGLLIEPANVDEISNKIVYLIEHNKVLKEMEDNAKKTYEEKLSFDVFAKHYIQFYEENM